MSVAIITGGASGLGDAISHRLADEGQTVVVADVDADGARATADAIGAEGNRAVAVTCDVTDRAAVDAMVAETAALGPISTLVLSAAIENVTPLVDLTDEDWQHVLDVDLKGPFLCMRAAIPHMVEHGGGSVIAMGSTLGLIVSPGHAAYLSLIHI